MPAFLFGPYANPTLDLRLSAAQAEPGGGKGIGRERRRVLIVEDEAMIAGLIEAILSERGWTVVGPAATLERALETIERERFDVALLDVRLKDHDAYVVADALSLRGIPFIFVSGFSRKQMPPAYRHCAHIAKPFTPRAILAALDEVVGRAGL